MVEWKNLGDICEIKTGRGITQKDCTEKGLYPVISGGQAPMGMYNQYNREANNITISRVGANAGYVNYIWQRFYLNDKCFSIIPFNDTIITKRYLYIILKNKEDGIRKLQSEGGVPTINTQKLSSLIIPVPSLSEQNHIVDKLDSFTSSIDNLKQQIAQRRKQYEYYRDKLLDLEGKEGVEMNSVAHFVKERIFANELTAQNYTSVENLLKDKAGRKDAENVPSEGNWIKYQKGDVLIGNIRPYLRKIWLSDREGGTNGDVIVIRAKEVLLPEFMFYCLASESFFLYYNQALKDGKMPRGEKNRVLSYIIPFIRKEEQQRIVSILDTFEASIQNLEAQLSQREKQYEYYRNKLLTFE